MWHVMGRFASDSSSLTWTQSAFKGCPTLLSPLLCIVPLSLSQSSVGYLSIYAFQQCSGVSITLCTTVTWRNIVQSGMWASNFQLKPANVIGFGKFKFSTRRRIAGHGFLSVSTFLVTLICKYSSCNTFRSLCRSKCRSQVCCFRLCVGNRMSSSVTKWNIAKFKIQRPSRVLSNIRQIITLLHKEIHFKTCISKLQQHLHSSTWKCFVHIFVGFTSFQRDGHAELTPTYLYKLLHEIRYFSYYGL
jgi:hypothetical protein